MGAPGDALSQTGMIAGPGLAPPPPAVGRDVGRLRRAELAADTGLLLPGLACIGLFVLWQVHDGGYPPTAWYPGALLVTVLTLGSAAVCRQSFRRPSWPVVAATGAFAAYTAWTFLSIVWADVPGDAWDGANRTLLYFTVFAFFALSPWRATSAGFLLGAFSVGTAAVVAGHFAAAVFAGDPTSSFIGARFSDPAGYINATAALVLMAFWPALVLASRREVPWLLRGVLLGCAGLLLQLGLLPQSRGALFAFPVVALLCVAVVPGRIRLLAVAAPVAAVVVGWWEPILDVYGTGEQLPELNNALDRAGRALLFSFIVLVAAGIVIALVDRRLQVSERLARRLRRIVALVAVAAAVAAIGATVAVNGNPFTRATDAWAEFKAGETENYAGSHLTGGLGSNRYDFWRVAVAEFKAHPVNGIGADNFAVPYVRARASGEEPLYPHSLVLGVLSQGGIVGTLFFVGFVALALLAHAKARLRLDAFGGALAGAALIAFAYWFVHGSVDWFWEFPALGAPALAWLGLSVGLARPKPERGEPEPSLPPPTGLEAALALSDLDEGRLGGRGRIVAALALVAVVAGVGTASYVFPWLAARNVDTAARTWRSDSEAAFDRLERARAFNPLSDRADVIAGTIASRISDLDRMRLAFTRALERNPYNWYAQLQLAIVDYLTGQRNEALQRIEAARSLNPSDSVLEDVERRMRAGETVTLRELDRVFLQRVEARTS
jgi:hypothetical protein